MVVALVLLPLVAALAVQVLGLSGRVWDALPVIVFVSVVVVMIVAGVAMSRRMVLEETREREGKCSKCGYDRTGLKIGDACPECGKAG
jgi:hypothetical protein